MSDWTNFTRGARAMMGRPMAGNLQYPQPPAGQMQQPQQSDDPMRRRIDNIRLYRESFRDAGGSSQTNQNYRPSTENYIDATPPKYIR